MDDQRDALWADASLRRPAVDPGIPRPDRDVLAARGALLPPAAQDRPARRRYYLPTEPARRLATIDGTVVGLTAAGLTALFGTTPLAVGVLIFQGPASWEAASNRFALLAAGIIAIVTTVILGVRVVRFGQPSGRTPAETAARTHHGRYLTGADFDARSRVLLRRAQDAIDAVTSSLVCRDDLLDRHATSAALTGQEWDIAVALREQAQLRARRAELRVRRAEWPAGRAGPQAAALLSQQDRAARLGPQAAALLSQQDRAAQLAEASTIRRVEALERYAAEVGAADSAYRDGKQSAALAELHDRHLDMLARTAADEHGIAEIDRLAAQARAVRRVLGEPPR
jgi:hypothetical protein